MAVADQFFIKKLVMNGIDMKKMKTNIKLVTRLMAGHTRINLGQMDNL